MRREAKGHARRGGADGAVKALLKSDGIILCGDIRAKLRRGGLTGRRMEGAAMIVAVLTGPGDLDAALRAGMSLGLRVWCVHGKGKGPAVGDAAVRDAFWGAGWMARQLQAVF